MEYKISQIDNQDKIFLWPIAESNLKLNELKDAIRKIGAYQCRLLSQNGYCIDTYYALDFNDNNLKAIKNIGFLEEKA